MEEYQSFHNPSPTKGSTSLPRYLLGSCNILLDDVKTASLMLTAESLLMLGHSRGHLAQRCGRSQDRLHAWTISDIRLVHHDRNASFCQAGESIGKIRGSRSTRTSFIVVARAVEGTWRLQPPEFLPSGCEIADQSLYDMTLLPALFFQCLRFV